MDWFSEQQGRLVGQLACAPEYKQVVLTVQVVQPKYWSN